VGAKSVGGDGGGDVTDDETIPQARRPPR